MFASRRDQENAAHTRHLTAAGKPAQGTAPKTPAKHSAQYGRRAHSDENTVRSGGKTEGKKDSQALVTPVARTARAPLTVRAANTKVFLKTPQPTVRPDRHPASSIKRTRRAQFKVHQAGDVQHEQIEEREIEYMAPRGEPLPDLPDEDIWPHDRTYEQLEGGNFCRGWAIGLIESDDEDFETKYQRALQNEERAKQAQNAANVLPVAVAHALARTAGVKPVKGYASATSASLARSTQRHNAIPLRSKKPASDCLRDRPVMSAGNRAVSRASASSNHSMVQLTANGLQEVLGPVDYLEDAMSHAKPSMTVDLLELEGLSDFQLDIPDD